MSGGADRMLTRVFFSSGRVLDGGIRATRGAVDGFWLGLLGPRQVARIDETYFEHQRMYLDEGYNRQGLWAWERAAIDTFFADASRLAVTGAGAGREVLALLELGHDAVGYECNEMLAEFGNDLTIASGYGLRIHAAERDKWPAPAVGFDGAVIGWGSYMHIAGRRRRVKFLADARSALPDGAPILLSFFARRGTSVRFRAVLRVGNSFRRLRGRDVLEAGDALAPLYAHFFTKDEVAGELDEAGFELVQYATEPYAHVVGRARGR
ncbi:MAG: hypothetical protein ABI658_04395 [Acidimicrobiales bacterium]